MSAAIAAPKSSIQPTLPVPTTNISSISAEQQPAQKAEPHHASSQAAHQPSIAAALQKKN